MELLIIIVFQLLVEIQTYNSLQKPIISVSKEDDLLLIACEIPLSIRADFICSLYTENDDLLYQSNTQWSQSGENLCAFNLNHSELLRRSVNSRQLTCVYSLKSEHENRSPNSDPYTIRVSTSATTEQTSTTAKETVSKSATTEQTRTTAKETDWLYFCLDS
ncbi:hypothetical protein Q8A67_021193 [Cirrhinus molitorella]|uniref:Ig-like domain-containing protein n=1 Tax=Cirrhinus molitorella TaxID=172907 RepID=A0AA88PA95_9TELE|nr:hypothetical protein Q8A67_021193 [Cirrhinus molitorella]